jgi:TonB family protein
LNIKRQGILSDKEGTVTFHGLNRVIAVGLLLIGGWAATIAPVAWGQEIKGQETNRKVKSKVSPVYPELARKMNISGVVKVRVTIAANGSVKDAQLVGGHPLLANAAMDAVKRWRFETRPDETAETVEFRFDPVQ